MNTHKKINNDKVEQAIACTLFYTDLERLDYDMMLMEFCWRYAAEFGSDSLVLSDTFWLWFRNQFFLKTIAFSVQIERAAKFNTIDKKVLKDAFYRLHRVDAMEVFPQSAIHNIITREVYAALREREGGVQW